MTDQMPLDYNFIFALYEFNLIILFILGILLIKYWRNK